MQPNNNINSLKYSFLDITHALSAFTVKCAKEFPASLRGNLEKIFFANIKANPAICFSLFANPLTREIVCNDEILRDAEIFYAIDSNVNRIKREEIFAGSPLYVSCPVPQWRYTNSANNRSILMLNILIELAYLNSEKLLGDYIRSSMVDPDTFDGSVIEPDGRFMVLTIIDESPFAFHASVSDADGSNFVDDNAAYFGFPILNGIRAFNFGDKPVKILYMPAV